MIEESELRTTPTSRLRISGSLRHAAGRAGLAERPSGPPPSQPRRLAGHLAERLGVTNALQYLQGLEARRGSHDWAQLLSGETSVSEGGVQLNTIACIRAAGAVNDTTAMSFGGAVKGPDYKALKQESPAGRFKFYHSFQDRERGEAYLTELIGQAAERGLSMTMKTFDHAYDGANVYTYHQQEMAELIAETYPKYADAFYSTEHFLQGSLGGVEPSHIGWVQEPGFSVNSHSTRMAALGAVLDEQGLNEDTYRAGCAAAGVVPEAPWLLNEASLDTVAQNAAARYGSHA